MSIASIKFNEEWNWDGWTKMDENVNDGAVDADGNLVLVGSQGEEALEFDDDTFLEERDGDFATVKLNGDGQVLWTWTGTSSGSLADFMLSVDTDGNNDVIMGGRTYGFWAEANSDETAHLAAVKLDGSSGLELWRYQESPPDSSTSRGDINYLGSGGVIGVTVDGDDNVFLVGQTYGSLSAGEGDPGDSDSFVIKLDGSDGSEVWRLQSGDGSDFDTFHKAKTNSAGDLVVVGISGQAGSIDFVVLRLSGADGSTLWEYSPSSTSSIDVLDTVDLDGEGNVYVAGGLGAENLQGGIAEVPVVLKLNGSTGEPVWTYEGVAESRAFFSGVAVDPTTGTVVAVGTTEGTWVEGAGRGGFDFAAVALNGSTGEELSRYQDGSGDTDYLGFVGFDPQGRLLVGGATDRDGHSDAVAFKFRLGEASVEERLAAWKVGAIVSGLAFALLLLVLCAGCFHRQKKRAKSQKKAGVQHQAPPPVVKVIPAAPTSAEVEAIPASPTPAPVPPPPALESPPPSYAVLCQPPSQDTTAVAAEPCLEANSLDVSPEIPAETPEANPTNASPEIPAETPAERLAKRKVPVASQKPKTRIYHAPRMYAPYAPAPNNT